MKETPSPAVCYQMNENSIFGKFWFAEKSSRKPVLSKAEVDAKAQNYAREKSAKSAKSVVFSVQSYYN